MLVQALVEDYQDEYHVRVRIPKFHKLNGTANATPTDQLPIATVCYQPGVLPTYSLGDIVYVEFENDNPSYPVIMGKLLTSNTEDKSWCDIKTRSLIVDVDTKLSSNTQIGDIRFTDLNFTVSYIVNQGEQIYNKADKGKIGTITLSTSWIGSDNLYYQIIPNSNISDVVINSNSKIDLQLDAEQLIDLASEGVTVLLVENNNSVVKIYCLGNAPTQEYVVQCLVTQVQLDEVSTT